MKIYLIRHADPDYTTDSLTKVGKSEARFLSEFLSTVQIDQLFTSPIARARETASYTESLLSKDAEVLEWTEEIKLPAPDGSDFMAWYMNPENFRSQTYEDNESWQKTIRNIELQSDAWLEGLGWKRQGHQYHFQPEKGVIRELQIALFCHGGFGLTWLAHLLQIPYHCMWSSFFLHTSSVTTILFDERPSSVATPRVIGLSALPHLYKNGMPPNTTGIKANYV